MAFIVNLYDIIEAHQSTLNVIYDETPFLFNNSEKTYECFVHVARCTYEHEMMSVFKMTHVILIGITIIAYIIIFITLRPQWQGTSPPFIKVTYLGLGKAIAMLMLALNTVLLFVIFRIDQYYIKECSKFSFIVRLENMLTYIVLNCIEAFYIMHDILSTSHKTGSLTPFEVFSRSRSESHHEETPLLGNNTTNTFAFTVNNVDQENNN